MSENPIIAARHAQRLQDAVLSAERKWLEKKWGAGGRACPYCDTNEWLIGGPVTLMYEGDPGQVELRRMSPHFTVMCRNCGHTVLINAMVSETVPEIIDSELEDES
jgi:hypothetical protein